MMEMAAIFRWPGIARYVLVVLIAAVALYAGYFIVMQLCIRYRRQCMEDYGRFVRSTYGRDQVSERIMRYHLREIGAYNRMRCRHPFRTLWKEAQVDPDVCGERKIDDTEVNYTDS